MKFSLKTFGVLLVCCFAAQAQNPVITTPNATIVSRPDNLVFNETKQVNLLCSSPDAGAVLHWGPIRVGKNPVVTDTKVTNQSREGMKVIQQNITYNPHQFVAIVNISCFAKIGTTTRTTNMTIEQLYRTHNVIINDGSKKLKVEPSKTDPNVKLECNADGNPNSTFYSWYNLTKIGATPTKLPFAGKTLAFSFREKTKFSYQCKARNDANSPWVESQFIEVSGSEVVTSSWILLAFSVLYFTFGQS